MKKILLALCMALIAGMACYAHKSYVTVRYYYNSMYYFVLSGDIPVGMKESYSSWQDDMTIGELLNMLSKNGYEVEQMAPYENGNTTYNLMFLLSSDTAPESSDSAGTVKTIRNNDGEDVYEVARYNLQGLPVSEDTKGVQIVVFSNYTTQTVIVE